MQLKAGSARQNTGASNLPIQSLAVRVGGRAWVARSAATWRSSRLRPGGRRGLRSAAAYAVIASEDAARSAAASAVRASIDLRGTAQADVMLPASQCIDALTICIGRSQSPATWSVSAVRWPLRRRTPLGVPPTTGTTSVNTGKAPRVVSVEEGAHRHRQLERRAT